MDLATLKGKEDWPQVQQRYEAWWDGELVDRVVIAITAPRKHLPEEVVPAEGLFDWWTNPERVIPRQERQLEATYFAGDAFPILHPVYGGMVAITAAFLGAPLRLVDTHTTWSQPIIDDWTCCPKFAFDPKNEWWLVARRLLEAGAERAPGNYCLSIPDLNGPGEILARLRGSAELAVDLIENPDEVLGIMPEVNYAWYRYWQACYGVVHQHVGGYVPWMGVWSELPASDLQTDFSCMISSAMFDCFFLPFIEEQTHLVERTVYHLDGPGAIRHLDSLLDLPRLSAIQWVPGAGAPPMSRWLPLLRRVQARGKSLHLSCEPWEVVILLENLEPEGLCLSTHCDSVQEADDLLLQATRLSVRRQWLVPGPD
ncbi:MAG: hypothetical protein ACUVWR_06590 [Anaerolineae bacterium]